MSREIAREYWDDWGLVLLNLAIWLGPLAVVLDLLGGYALVKPLCADGHPERLRMMSLAALVIAGTGMFIGWRCMFQLAGKARDEGGRVIDRSYFAALVAMGLDGLCVLVILAAAGARMLMTCE